jgi:hypothetical protein
MKSIKRDARYYIQLGFLGPIYLGVLALGLNFDALMVPQQVLNSASQTYDQLRTVSESLKRAQLNRDGKFSYLDQDVFPVAADSLNDATILTFLKVAAANQGIELARSNEFKPIRPDGVNWIGVSIGLNATEAALLKFIAEIEQAKPILIIDKLTWQSTFQPNVELQFPAIHAIEMDISAVSLASPSQSDSLPAP